jgi:hypothetical protein
MAMTAPGFPAVHTPDDSVALARRPRGFSAYSDGAGAGDLAAQSTIAAPSGAGRRLIGVVSSKLPAEFIEQPN